MTGGVGLGVKVLVRVGGIGVMDGVKVKVGSGVRVTSRVAVARGVSVTSGASVAVGMTSVLAGGWQAASVTPIIKAILHVRIVCIFRVDIGMTRLIVILAVIFVVRPILHAQPDSTVFLNSNTPVVLRLAGDGRPAEAVFEGEAGQIITVAAQAADPTTVDTALEWVAPDGERMAYNDDWAGERTDLTPPDGVENLAVTDSALVRMILPETGSYTARVNTFNGEGVGDVTLTVVVEEVRALVIAESRLVGLHRAEIAEFTLEMSAGQTVSLTAMAIRGRLDPMVSVVDSAGTIIAENDDHGTVDTALNTFDSRLTFTAPADGVYSVRLRDFLGRAGAVMLVAQ